MRDFSWNYFSMTGDVDAYLLFKQTDSRGFRFEDEDDYDDDEAYAHLYEESYS